MNTRTIIALCVAVAVIAGTWVIAAQPNKAASGGDPQLDKIIEQNEQILKNQAEILKTLQDVQTGINTLRRRSS